jgi:hypothetical protein
MELKSRHYVCGMKKQTKNIPFYNDEQTQVVFRNLSFNQANLTVHSGLVQVILFEINCAIFYTNFHELLIVHLN